MLTLKLTRASIAEGRRLRAAGDQRIASLKALEEAVGTEPSNATAIIDCGYDCLALGRISGGRGQPSGEALELEPTSRERP